MIKIRIFTNPNLQFEQLPRNIIILNRERNLTCYGEIFTYKSLDIIHSFNLLWSNI
jgi:hypothetical protein